jgi:hypothetical protein
MKWYYLHAVETHAIVTSWPMHSISRLSEERRRGKKLVRSHQALSKRTFSSHRVSRVLSGYVVDLKKVRSIAIAAYAWA